eukprot:snap_masked-scaffold_5-processed-gene-16.33-mRNA-1 protein AED:1.00 eAED:1.00 QI:0/-1/0/0/-1/1/1/0/64
MKIPYQAMAVRILPLGQATRAFKSNENAFIKEEKNENEHHFQIKKSETKNTQYFLKYFLQPRKV